MDRSLVPCYWEKQPSGCAKGADCPFKHEKAATADDATLAAATAISGVAVAAGVAPLTGIVINRNKVLDVDALRKEVDEKAKRKEEGQVKNSYQFRLL